MKTIILAGGLGTRIPEYTQMMPKSMIKIGSVPLLTHIMRIYTSHGFNEFIICLGYKGEVIKDYFTSYYSNNRDLTVDLGTNNYEVHNQHNENWKISLIDTGSSVSFDSSTTAA